MPLCHAANASILGLPSPVRWIRQQYLNGATSRRPTSLATVPPSWMI